MILLCSLPPTCWSCVKSFGAFLLCDPTINVRKPSTLASKLSVKPSNRSFSYGSHVNYDGYMLCWLVFVCVCLCVSFIDFWTTYTDLWPIRFSSVVVDVVVGLLGKAYIALVLFFPPPVIFDLIHTTRLVNKMRLICYLYAHTHTVLYTIYTHSSRIGQFQYWLIFFFLYRLTILSYIAYLSFDGFEWPISSIHLRLQLHKSFTVMM